jgi:hypothetical protein
MARHAATLALSLARRLRSAADEIQKRDLLCRDSAARGYAISMATPTIGSTLLKTFPISTADRLGVSKRLFSSWKSGAHRPGPAWRARLAIELGIDASAWDRPLATAHTLAASLSRRLVEHAKELSKTTGASAPL